MADVLNLDGYRVEVHQWDGSGTLYCTTCCVDVPVQPDAPDPLSFSSAGLSDLVLAAQEHERYRHRFGREAHPAPPTGRAG